jgi:hypothetical protein
MGTRELLAKLPVGKHRIDLTSTTLSTAAWTSLIASLQAACTAISVAYTGEGILKFSSNAGTSELPLYITPGMNHEMLIPLELKKASVIHARCVDQNVATGELVINLYG